MEENSEPDDGDKPLLGRLRQDGMGHIRTLTEQAKLGRLAGLVPSRTVLISYCALSTTIIVILVATMLARQPHAVANPGSFQASFGADSSYMSLDHKFDDLWEDLGSKDLIIKLPDAGNGGKPTHGTISMFHQLHCLSSLRNALQQAREGIDPGLDWRDNDHWPHCLDYLRKVCRRQVL